jgi:hypothetical protein
MEARTYEDQRSTYALGLTLLAVFVNIGVSVFFGVSGPWWVRLGAGLLTTVVLAIFVALASRKLSLLRRLANWLTQV